MYSFEAVEAEMKRHQMILPIDKVRVQIPDSKQILKEALTYFLNKENRKLEWLPEYNQVADWMKDNDGRGLFLYGNCGRGKSLLSRYVLPAILLKFSQKVVSVFDVQDMNKNIDYVLSKHIIAIDDVGTEEISNVYGNKRTAFKEVMDAVEKYNKLLIVSTNMSADELKRFYDDRTFQRVLSTTRRIPFDGKSLRRI